MKKYILYIIIFNFFILANNELAIVTKSKGLVQYKANNSNKFINSINSGLELYNDDLLKTGNNGFVMFAYLDDGSLIKVHKDSEIYVTGKIDSKNINKRLNVNGGIFRFDVKEQKGDEFTVVTPSSVASVKGTDFIIDVSENGDLFYGLDGLVEIVNKTSNKVVRLSKNNKVESSQSGILNQQTITKDDLLIIQQIETESEVDNIDQNNIGPELDDNDSGMLDDSQQNIKEIRILVTNPSGDEKEIIIRYSE